VAAGGANDVARRCDGTPFILHCRKTTEGSYRKPEASNQDASPHASKERSMARVIASRGTSYVPNDPSERIFNILDYAKAFPGDLKPTRMYTSDEYRVAVFRMLPGQAQEVHVHPSTTHAWFVLSGTGTVTMEGDREQEVGTGTFCAHPRSSVHGIVNTGTDELVYVVLSIGD
jgi:mannose-6-phosphate isomerase-like protein (cupin superfamily)